MQIIIEQNNLNIINGEAEQAFIRLSFILKLLIRQCFIESLILLLNVKIVFYYLFT